MRTRFFHNVSKYAARKLAPWAAVIATVDGGYMAFESREDWLTWRRQR